MNEKNATFAGPMLHEEFVFKLNMDLVSNEMLRV